jgi:hypothetical protein
MPKAVALQFQAHQHADVIVLSEEGRRISGTIEDVNGRQLLLILDQVVSPGASLKVEWNNYVVLAEVQYQTDWHNLPAFVIKVEHLIRRDPVELIPRERSAPLPHDSLDQAVAMRRLLFGIRVAALNFDQDRYDAFQANMISLERSLDRDASGANCLKVSEEAVKALAANRKHVLDSVSSHLGDIRTVISSFAQAIAALEALPPQVKAQKNEGWDSSIGESLFDLEIRFSNLLDKFA